ncbi:MAG: transcriptional repressor [Bacteroidales bacterium]|nr:transcriptional repressor [Bacteroidales bacterium]
MMDSKVNLEVVLEEAGIRVTAVRLLIFRTINEKMSGAFSLADVENEMPSLDRSTIFRTLSLFAEKHVLHLIDDGSGMQKYCVCQCSDKHHHHGHIHVTCTVCHETFCLNQVEIPNVPVPKGWTVEESEYIIKGICPKCSK